MTAQPRVIPVTDDPDTRPFFDAAREGRLVVRRCNDCDSGLHPPTPYCPCCGSWDTGWSEVNGTGRLFSWTVIEHTIHPAFPAPTTIVLVEVDGVSRTRLVGHVPGRPALEPGMPMRVTFEKLADGVVQPNWTVAL